MHSSISISHIAKIGVSLQASELRLAQTFNLALYTNEQIYWTKSAHQHPKHLIETSNSLCAAKQDFAVTANTRETKLPISPPCVIYPFSNPSPIMSLSITLAIPSVLKF
jgi:hypothetical protein